MHLHDYLYYIINVALHYNARYAHTIIDDYLFTCVTRCIVTIYN